MLLFYGLLRSIVAMLAKQASWSHKRAQSRYEKLDSVFTELEQDCKASEVEVGRPMDFVSQLQLLKSFEAREAAKKTWVKRARVKNRRETLAKRIVAFSGKKLPYSFGLIDMALVMNALDAAGVSVNLQFISSYLMSLVA